MSGYTYEQLLEINDMSTFNPEESIGILGAIFEISKKQQDLKILTKWIKVAEDLNTDSYTLEEKARYHFNVSNGWNYIKQVRLKSPNNIEFHSEETVHVLRNLRIALNYCEHFDDAFLKSQLLVNLGCTLSHLGRCTEAVSYWNEALSVNPNFGMAIGNLGYGIFHYGKMLEDTAHVVMFSQYAHKLLMDACDSEDVYSEAKDDFMAIAKSIEDVIGQKQLSYKFNLYNHHMGDSDDEIQYREWCLHYKLYLNYANDIYQDPIAARDCLSLPKMSIKMCEPLVYHDLFNQLKQEFSSARYFVYKGITNDTTHFADKGNTIVDTMKMAEYSHNIEMLKSGFRMCYSILDKIAMFINLYFSIGVNVGRVSFGRVWYENKKIKDKLANSPNWLLRGIYSLSRDFYSDGLAVADPNANDIAKIRNFIEHRAFKVGYVDTMQESKDGVTLEIDRYYFEDQCLRTISLVRAAIIYLTLAVAFEEKFSQNVSSKIQYKLNVIDDNNKK